MESQQRVWLLIVKGKQIEDALTIPGTGVVRRMTLTKSD